MTINRPSSVGRAFGPALPARGELSTIKIDLAHIVTKDDYLAFRAESSAKYGLYTLPSGRAVYDRSAIATWLLDIRRASKQRAEENWQRSKLKAAS